MTHPKLRPLYTDSKTGRVIVAFYDTLTKSWSRTDMDPRMLAMMQRAQDELDAKKSKGRDNDNA